MTECRTEIEEKLLGSGIRWGIPMRWIINNAFSSTRCTIAGYSSAVDFSRARCRLIVDKALIAQKTGEDADFATVRSLAEKMWEILDRATGLSEPSTERTWEGKAKREVIDDDDDDVCNSDDSTVASGGVITEVNLIVQMGLLLEE